ncbi:MAG TPA: LptF/LptG family permease [Tenuifilaceae bacterium]|nr:LptF/LptG family permease [Tenuifilaceae bacterium]HPE19507.1 LptF/LptG family permease [Tenuifilaceae bacterium]HPJ46807.1 LptF/LptG family permease [Tenuifilaceae bacterium]HPQ35279.1 LptF/LptG family permease [Tenuifilaceae bacterium]HRX69031.1 LptF/LptG family permease [Tenuifilaceae bacterium]
MKTLHRFVLKSYLGPLFMTFFIVMFILLMQFLWKYIDDLVGKGLDLDVIMELLLYASAGLVPMALPLATLLASLMTLGNLGENNELLAMKSAGISLPRIMSPLIVLAILVSISAFFFANNVLPHTNLKISSLLYDVKQQRPELQIKPGIFNNDIDGYSIKVAQKDPRTNLMRKIMIYDHRSNEGNLVVTVADSGYMQVTDDEKYMIVTLFNGYTYEEMKENVNARRAPRKFPARRNKFDEQIAVLELKGFGFQRTNEDLFKSNFQVMNLSQLENASDSLEIELGKRKESFQKTLLQSTLIRNPFGARRDSGVVATYSLNTDSILNSMPEKIKQRTINRALANARAAKNYVTSSTDEFYHRGKYIARHKVEWNRKLALSFACLVFFFIGAPLGAIIRKGGLGMPVVVSVLFFVLYYVITLTGEKFVRELVWQPGFGMWISSFILLPLGVFLSYKATTDSVILNADYYILIMKKFVRLHKKHKIKHASN